jgi:hypothetical protein
MTSDTRTAMVAPLKALRTGQRSDSLHLTLALTAFFAQPPAGGPSAPPTSIASAAPDLEGGIFVLDAHRWVIYHFDRRGRLTEILGGAGHKPGEMFYPSVLATGAGDWVVYALDPGNQRIDGFGPRPATRAIEIPLLRASSGLCLVDSMFVSFGVGGTDSLLRVVGFDGDRRANIGKPYARESMVEQTLAEGFLGCVPRRHIVMVVATSLPEIRAYDLQSGQLSWTSTLHGYHQQQVTLIGKQVIVSAPPEGFTQSTSLSILGTVLAVQVAYVPPMHSAPQRERGQVLTTEFFDANNGTYLGSQTDIGRVVAATDQTLFIVDDSLRIRGYSFVFSGPRP